MSKQGLQGFFPRGPHKEDPRGSRASSHYEAGGFVRVGVAVKDSEERGEVRISSRFFCLEV